MVTRPGIMASAGPVIEVMARTLIIRTATVPLRGAQRL